MRRMLGWLASSIAVIGAAGCLLMSSAVAAPFQIVPAPASSASPPLTDYVPGELIVRYKSGTTASDRVQLNSAQGARQQRQLQVPRAYLLRLQKGDDVRATARAYERDPDVQYAQPNYIDKPFATPNEPGFALQWPLNNTGQTVQGIAGTPDADIDAPEAWNTITGSSAVTVGIADTGIAYDAPDLTGNIWLNPGESGAGKETNNVDDDGNGKIDDFRGWDFSDEDNDPMDDESHGSNVAGIIGAVGNNGYGVVGVNWNVRVAALRMCSPNPFLGCNQADQADAFAYAAQKGMKVVNGSFGGYNFGQIVADAIANAPNVLFVFAAGNDNIDNDATPAYPCAYPSANVICVAASDQNDAKPSFSNFGDTNVDLAAPGTNVVNVWPNVVRFQDDFQANNFASRWTTGGTNNTWARACSGPSCFMTDSPAGNYQHLTQSWSQNTTSFSTTDMSACRVQFLATWNLADEVTLEYSPDNIFFVGDPALYYFDPGSSNWQYIVVDMGPENNNQANLWIRWFLSSGNAVPTTDGIYVDDVSVRCRRVSYAAGNEFANPSGTSMASPHVAGAAALAFAKIPGASVAAVKDAILEGADKKASLSGLVATGARLNLNGMLTRLSAGYARPKGATPLRVPLVPAYTQCTSPNRFHGPPDLPGGTNPDGSCASPTQLSTQLTVGTPDATPSGPAANSSGFLKAETVIGNPGTPADEANLALSLSITDVRRKTTGLPDYTGQLEARTTLRLTDNRSGAGGNEYGTIQDVPFEFTVPCTSTASTTIGSTCSINTSADALQPGIAVEGARGVWQLSQVQVADGGADGVASTEPNTIFATQGVFVP